MWADFSPDPGGNLHLNLYLSLTGFSLHGLTGRTMVPKFLGSPSCRPRVPPARWGVGGWGGGNRPETVFGHPGSESGGLPGTPRIRSSGVGIAGLRARPGIQNPEFRIASEPLTNAVCTVQPSTSDKRIGTKGGLRRPDLPRGGWRRSEKSTG